MRQSIQRVRRTLPGSGGSQASRSCAAGLGKKNRARNMLFTKGGNISVHHSLFALGKFRNPQIKTSDPDAVTNIVNNVFYSPRWEYVVSFGDEWSASRANVVGNYKIAGENERGRSHGSSLR